MLRRWLALSPRDRRLVAAAAVLLVCVQVGVRALSYRRLRRCLALLPSQSSADDTELDEVGGAVRWAVDVADRRTPGAARCLERALVAERLLVRRGQDATLRFGIDGAVPGATAHAWVESDGEVVVGGGNLDEYAVLERWDVDG